MQSKITKIILFSLGMAVLAGCSSGKLKARKEERDRVEKSSHFYCEFVNGETYPDIEVQLNLDMAKRCDTEQPFSVSNYRSPSENLGLVYCCNTKAAEAGAPVAKDAKEPKELKDTKEPKTTK